MFYDELVLCPPGISKSQSARAELLWLLWP
jgi:hypothetical protein